MARTERLKAIDKEASSRRIKLANRDRDIDYMASCVLTEIMARIARGRRPHQPSILWLWNNNFHMYDYISSFFL